MRIQLQAFSTPQDVLEAVYPTPSVHCIDDDSPSKGYYGMYDMDGKRFVIAIDANTLMPAMLEYRTRDDAPIVGEFKPCVRHILGQVLFDFLAYSFPEGYHPTNRTHPLLEGITLQADQLLTEHWTEDEIFDHFYRG